METKFCQCCNYLGVNYRDGVGFEKNIQTAYSYFKKILL